MDEHYLTIEYTTADEIKRIRRLLGFTQSLFAEFVGCSKPTVERWEMSDKPITGPIVRLLQMLEADPEYVERVSIPQKKLPVRMWYVFKNKKCTLIDVDDSAQKVFIKNYTDNLQFRAFGVNETPTYKDYLDFLESRCFPRERDGMKTILEDLNLPFYDPVLIVKKTGGCMAEDCFCIEFE